MTLFDQFTVGDIQSMCHRILKNITNKLWSIINDLLKKRQTNTLYFHLKILNIIIISILSVHILLCQIKNIHALLKENVPRGTLKINSVCFIFGTSKNHVTECFVKYPLVGFIMVPLVYFGGTTRQVLWGTTSGYLTFNISNLISATIHKFK